MTDGLSQWSWVTVADLGSVTGGLTQNSKRDAFPLQLPYLRVANVYANELRMDQVSMIGVQQNEVARALLEKADLLVVEGNGSLDQIGRVAVWDGAVAPCLHQNHIIKVRFYPATISRFALYWLLSSAGRDQITRVASSTSGLHTLSISKVQALRMPLAPLAEQGRISEAIESYFSRLDDAMATLERAERNLKRYRASVLRSAVEGRLVPTEAALAKQEGRTYEPASVLLERILTERRRRWSESGKKGKYQEPTPPDTTNLRKLPKLPEGWCWATVDQLATDVGYGSSSKTQEGLEAGVPVLRMGNIVDGYLDYSELKYLPSEHSEFPDLLLSPGDILFNRTNSPELVGKTAVFSTSEKSSFASYLIRVRVAGGVQPRYVSHFINSSYGRNWVKSVVTQVVGQANVNGTKLKACVIPLPPLVEQTRIVDEVERVLSLVFATATQVRRDLTHCRRLRQAILKWAFEGKLADQDPTDEPASVLLERIKAERTTAKPAKPATPQRKAAKKKARA